VMGAVGIGFAQFFPDVGADHFGQAADPPVVAPIAAQLFHVARPVDEVIGMGLA